MLIAAVLSWLLTDVFIKISRQRGWGQPVREDGPETHLIKQGTPTAGGVAFTLVTVGMWFAMSSMGMLNGVNLKAELLIVLSAIGMGLVGGVDDVLKIRSRMHGGKKELLAREKFPLQLLVGFAFAFFAVPHASHALLPSMGFWPDVIFYTFVMVGAVNAFNFTDGLDGLLTGVALIVMLPLLFVSPVAALLAGALLGFLWFNTHPAKVFMGDMGSHAIGAVVAGAYIFYIDAWALPIAAVVPVAAVLSVVIQVFSFRTREKRVFLMTPIQHHFEKLGWPETKVTLRFWVVTALATALVWLLIGGRP